MTIDAADLRAQRARHRCRSSCWRPVSACIRPSPGAVLNGRLPLRADLAQRIMAALKAIVTERRPQ